MTTANVPIPTKLAKRAYLVLCLIFPPMCIELLSGSTPPVHYFNPITILFFMACYGLPFILIREAKIRWQLDVSFMWLFPILGIFIEGIFMQSFFNTAHMDLGILSGLGMVAGVQWPWTIYLIIFHGIYGILVPMYAMDILFPSIKKVTLISRKGLKWSFGLIILVTLLQYMVIASGDQPMYSQYQVGLVPTMVCCLVISLLTLMAYLFRHIKYDPQPHKNRLRHHSYGFLYLFAFLLITFLPAESIPGLIVPLQLLMSILLLAFFKTYVYGTDRQSHELIPLFNGVVVFFALFAIGQEHGVIENLDPTIGMADVGYGFLLLTFFMNLRIIMKKRNEGLTTSSE